MSESPSPDLQARLRQKVETLKPFLKHAADCGALVPPYTYCSCGLNYAYADALEALREAASSRPPSPSPDVVKGLELFVDEISDALSSPLTPRGRDVIRTILLAFTAHVRRQAALPSAPSPLPQTDVRANALRDALCYILSATGGSNALERVIAIAKDALARDNEAWDRAAASAPSPQPSADTSPIMDRGHVGSGASPEAPPSTPEVGSSSLEAVGFVTTTGARLCRECAVNSDLLEAHRCGELQRPIVHPAPHGRYLGRKESAEYDKPCWICGWAIRG